MGAVCSPSLSLSQPMVWRWQSGSPRAVVPRPAASLTHVLTQRVHIKNISMLILSKMIRFVYTVNYLASGFPREKIFKRVSM